MKTNWRTVGRSCYLLTTLLLLAKAVLLRHFLYGEVLWNRVPVDFAAILVMTSLVELIVPMRAKRSVYWGVNLAVTLIFFAAAVYFQHFGSVLTYTSLYEVKQLHQVSSSVKSTIKPDDFLFFLDFAAAIAVYVWRRTRHLRPVQADRLKRAPIAGMALLGAVVSVGYLKADDSITNELKRAEYLGFWNYQASSFFNLHHSSKNMQFASLEEASQAIYSAQHQYPYVDAQNQAPDGTRKEPAYFGSQKGKNVIVVQMEAFQNFPLHLQLDGQEITPVLSKLADESFYFPHLFQQIGQGNTSDAEFISNTSLYPTGKMAMSTQYGDRSIPSMPKLMEARNYTTYTFHINDVTFWDRDKLYPALGWMKYFDKPYYENDHFNEFGASDENLYKEAVKELSDLNAQNKPFYAQIVTASSHHPFKIPADRVRITVPESMKGKQLGDYLEAINYTDYAIGQLIEELKANGMWDNTVLVFYGDHFGLQPEDTDPKVVSEELGINYEKYMSRYNIPLIIHTPGMSSGQVVNRVGGQLDIMPTIANLLGISLDQEKQVHFGHDLLNIDRNVFGMRYYLPTGSFFNDEVMFIPGKGFDDGTAYSLKTMEPVADIEKYRSDYDYIMDYMNLSDEYMKLLPKR